MFIETIILNNYRAYRGENIISFKPSEKNIFLIAGNNGFGKTTFLTSLIWCLYGKLMVDVDEKFRRDVNDAQGYKNYSKQSFNQTRLKEISTINLTTDDKKYILKNGYSDKYHHLQAKTTYFVEIHISDVFIPAIPCSQITIKRTYDYILEQENVEVLIDGHPHELAREVGYDFFITDYILSKEIAKFFFFDAEKIVSIAEVKTLAEKRRLSGAFSEVLGIKKYEDIKRNLENLRLKFRKTSGASASRSQLESTSLEIEKIEQRINEAEVIRTADDTEIYKLRSDKETIQEKLIREGNAISLEELSKQKALLATLKDKDILLKNKLKEMMDIAPFAISGSLMQKLQEQVDKEKSLKLDANTSTEINKALRKTQIQLLDAIKSQLGYENYNYLNELITNAFDNNIRKEIRAEEIYILLDYTQPECNEFQALYDNIRLSYNVVFKQLVKDLKNNSIIIAKTQRKIAAAELSDNDIEIKTLRKQRDDIDKRLLYLEGHIRNISENIGILSKELNVKKKRLSELTKIVKVDAAYQEKDAVAERLISEISEFLYKLRISRKSSLEQKIKLELDKLMHKIDFIHSVRVDIDDNIIDINLLDHNNQVINKEKLSKGEQQLYATAILKSLVDESGILFPVFIDSPLQKFDQVHAKNIITKFYPTISKQVVIFPLLGKELSFDEYEDLLPNINTTFVIRNSNGNSYIETVPSNRLFEMK